MTRLIPSRFHIPEVATRLILTPLLVLPFTEPMMALLLTLMGVILAQNSWRWLAAQVPDQMNFVFSTFD